MSEPPAPLRKTGHAKARAGAERRRAEAIAVGLDDGFVATLVERFYAAIRGDATLGPIFTARIAEWPVHLERMNRFWRAILHGSGEYSGNPMQAHMALPGLTEAHFIRWLTLFYATLHAVAAERGLGAAEQAHVARRARMIADSLLTGIATRARGLAGARAGADLPDFTPAPPG